MRGIAAHHIEEAATFVFQDSSEAIAVSDEPFFALRARAYELANSKHYKRWDQIAYALKAEGFLPSLITRFNQDTLAVMMITRCCMLARQS